MQSETLAARICTCCRVLCCPALRSAQKGDPSEEKEGAAELTACSSHLSYLLEQSLLHGVRNGNNNNNNGSSAEKKEKGDEDVFSALVELTSSASVPEYLELAELTKSLASTPQGQVRVFVRQLFNRGLYPSFITFANASTAYLE